MPVTTITPSQIEFIKNYYHSISATNMAKQLGISENVVNRYKRKRGWLVSKEQIRKWASETRTGRTSFTAQEDEIIATNYLSIPIKQLAKNLGRSYTGIMGRINAMGLEIPKEIREDRKAIGMYRKGQAPPNKGRKQVEYMSAEAIERTAKTRFRAGNKPHNSLPEGTVIIKKERKSEKWYKYEVQPKGRMELYHKMMWERVNGKIPESHCLWFLDGDTMNVELENLELITRAENMRRNSIHNNPAEIQTSIRLISKLNKKLKQYGNNINN